MSSQSHATRAPFWRVGSCTRVQRGDRRGTDRDYESTKFQAELWVQLRMREIPTTIYRPAIVVGDSRTGQTEKFDGPYYMLRTIARAAERHGPIPQLGSEESPFNVVPVDFIVAAIVAASSDEAARGETLHLVDPEPISAAELARVLSREYAGKEPSLRVPAAVAERSLRIKRVREYFSGAPPESITYLNHPVRFDTRKASQPVRRAVNLRRVFPFLAPGDRQGVGLEVSHALTLEPGVRRVVMR